MIKNNKNVHIALDFDKTLAHHESGWGISKVGDAIEPMLIKVKDWLSKGYKITIFTARVSEDKPTLMICEQIDFIQGFLAKNNLPALPITANKYPHFTHFVDDRAYHVERNTGKISDSIDI
jgi:hypothetical protein